jgi:hypothetical protein
MRGSFAGRKTFPFSLIPGILTSFYQSQGRGSQDIGRGDREERIKSNTFLNQVQ